MKAITVPQLKVIREQKGWAQETLAHYAGVSKRTIQRLEAGGNTSVESAKALAATLGIHSYDALCQPSDEPARSRAALAGNDEFGAVVWRAMKTPVFYFNVIVLLLAFEVIPTWLFDAASTKGSVHVMVLAASVITLSALASLSWRATTGVNALAVSFLLLTAWVQSSPTSGWGAMFYTAEQVEKFRLVAEAKEAVGAIRKTLGSRSNGESRVSAGLHAFYNVPAVSQTWNIAFNKDGELVGVVEATKDLPATSHNAPDNPSDL